MESFDSDVDNLFKQVKLMCSCADLVLRDVVRNQDARVLAWALQADEVDEAELFRRANATNPSPDSRCVVMKSFSLDVCRLLPILGRVFLFVGFRFPLLNVLDVFNDHIYFVVVLFLQLVQNVSAKAVAVARVAPSCQTQKIFNNELKLRNAFDCDGLCRNC